MDLLNIMSKDQISTEEKVVQLSSELGEFFNSKQIRRCKTMGEIVKQTLRHILKPYMVRLQRNIGKIID
jgi:hypothetical protein